MYLSDTGDVGALAGDGTQTRNELVMVQLQIVDEFLGLQVPDEERTRPFGLVAADQDASVVGDQQRIEEAVLAHFERGHTVAVLQTHQVDVHAVPRQRHHVRIPVQTEQRQFLVHDTCHINPMQSHFSTWYYNTGQQKETFFSGV